MIRDTDVARVADTIVALYNPDEIFVFGSYAKGTVHADSDLDVLVIKPSSLPRFRRGRDLAALLATMAFSVDVLFFTPDEVRLELSDPYSLLSSIMASAKLIYRRGAGATHVG